MNENGNSRTAIFAGILGALALLIIIMTVTIINNNKKDPPKEKPTPTAEAEGPTQVPDGAELPPGSAASTILIEEMDLDGQTMNVLDLVSGEEYSLSYTGATNIKNKHGKVISAQILKPGYIADITYEPEDMSLKSLKGCDRTWEYKGILNLAIDDSLKKMTISDSIYRYDDKLRILSGENFVTLNDLSSEDVFSLVGIDNYAYLLKVDMGHGYLELTGHEDFVGGTLSIGRTKTITIGQEVKVLLAEGTYDVTAVNGEYEASASIMIDRDGVSRFDLSPYGSAMYPKGTVRFTIAPENALLYIDGIYTDYKDPVQLSYGEHFVEVVLAGYNPYKGYLNVSGTAQTCNITLSEAEEETPDPDSLTEDMTGPTDTPGADGIEDSTSDGTIPDNTSQDPDTTPIPTIDTQPDDDPDDDAGNDVTPTTAEPTPQGDDEPTTDPSRREDGTHKMIIECTEGTRVYIDGEYSGTIAAGKLEIPKQIGEMTIRLELDGYTPKSYMIEVEDEDEDVRFSFPDLVKR